MSSPESPGGPYPPKPRDTDLDVYGLTHPGLVRKHNEDHFILGSLHQRLNVISTSLTEPERDRKSVV